MKLSNGSEVIVKPYQEEDAEEIVNLITRNFKEVNVKDYGEKAIIALLTTHDVNWFKGVAEYAHIYVFWNEGKVVGVGSISSFWGSPTESILLTIFVLPEFHGQGIAQKAIQLCEELHGNGNWELETILQEPRNCHLYEKMGYRQTRKTKGINERQVQNMVHRLNIIRQKVLYTQGGVRNLTYDDILVEMISVDEQEHVAVFVISSNDKKIIYTPCDVKPFPKSEKFQGADVLIIGNTIVGETLKGGFVLNEDNPLRKELFTLDEIDTMRIQYDIKRVIITHLEEDICRRPNSLCRLLG